MCTQPERFSSQLLGLNNSLLTTGEKYHAKQPDEEKQQQCPDSVYLSGWPAGWLAGWLDDGMASISFAYRQCLLDDTTLKCHLYLTG